MVNLSEQVSRYLHRAALAPAPDVVVDARTLVTTTAGEEGPDGTGTRAAVAVAVAAEVVDEVGGNMAETEMAAGTEEETRAER